MKPAQERLTRARAWLSLRYPFLAVLALHLPEREAQVATAQTDGRRLEYNPSYLLGLSDEQTRGLLLHLVLHAALGHPWRRGTRDHGRWELACDIVVNGVIRKLGAVRLPPGADTVDVSLESEAVEVVYDRLPAGNQAPSSGLTSPEQPSPTASKNDLEGYWQEARSAAQAVGDTPLGLERHYPTMRSRTDWRGQLRRYLVTASRDYFWNPPDRRMMAFDLIYPALAGETARVIVAVDTSGSVSRELIGAFMAEVRAIAVSHPDISGLVIYADATVNEVHDLRTAVPPKVIGGGGTDYTPVLRELERRREQPQVLIYLTDAQPATWPPRPAFPVVWAVPDQPLETRPPYGELIVIGKE